MTSDWSEYRQYDGQISLLLTLFAAHVMAEEGFCTAA